MLVTSFYGTRARAKKVYCMGFERIIDKIIQRKKVNIEALCA